MNPANPGLPRVSAGEPSDPCFLRGIWVLDGVNRVRRTPRLLVSATLVALACVLGIELLKSYRTGMVRPKALYVATCFVQLRMDMSRRAQADPAFVLPRSLPDTYTDAFDFGDGRGRVTWEASYADPFDTRPRPGETRFRCEVRQEGRFNGDPVDFSFRGNKLKYVRLDDHRALMLSYGPDLDQDILPGSGTLGAIDSYEFARGVLAPRTYDSTNGTISNGDIWYYLDIGSVPSAAAEHRKPGPLPKE